MKAQGQKVFRIERKAQPAAGITPAAGNAPAARDAPATAAVPASEDAAAFRHRELMTAIAALETRFAPAQAATEQVMNGYMAEAAEAQKFRAELDEIYKAIGNTKREIATLHHSGVCQSDLTGVGDELDAIVSDTEQATETILEAAEHIDSDASSLVASIKDKAKHDLACDIQEKVVMVFEACNFQDLTGQRITKVINTLKFVEERIITMMDIWGGIEAFQDVEPVEGPGAEGDAALMHGPLSDDDPRRASQDDIDSLFD